jgi:hypothetical protein
MRIQSLDNTVRLMRLFSLASHSALALVGLSTLVCLLTAFSLGGIALVIPLLSSASDWAFYGAALLILPLSILTVTYLPWKLFRMALRNSLSGLCMSMGYVLLILAYSQGFTLANVGKLSYIDLYLIAVEVSLLTQTMWISFSIVTGTSIGPYLPPNGFFVRHTLRRYNFQRKSLRALTPHALSLVGFLIVLFALGAVLLVSVDLIPSPYTAEGGSVLIPLLIGIVAFTNRRRIASQVQRLTRRVRVRLLRNAESLKEADQRPPILFLRSFRDERVSAPAPDRVFRFLVGLDQTDRLEEVICRATSRLGPVFALSAPGQEEDMIGAARAVSSDSWRIDVERYVAEAGLIILVHGHSEGLMWELDMIKKGGLLTSRVLRKSRKGA